MGARSISVKHAPLVQQAREGIGPLSVVVTGQVTEAQGPGPVTEGEVAGQPEEEGDRSEFSKAPRLEGQDLHL